MTDDHLSTVWNLGSEGDDVYAALMAAHEGLTDGASTRRDIGHRANLAAAIALAKSASSDTTVGS